MAEHKEVAWCPSCASTSNDLNVGDECTCGNNTLVSVDELILPAITHAVKEGFITKFCCCGLHESNAYICIDLPSAIESPLKEIFAVMISTGRTPFVVADRMYYEDNVSVSIDVPSSDRNKDRLSIYAYANDCDKGGKIKESDIGWVNDKIIKYIDDIEAIYEDICKCESNVTVTAHLGNND